MTSKPTDDVVLSLKSSDEGEGKVVSDNVSFGTSDWNTEKLVTIRGVDDNVSDGDQSYRIVVGSDNTTDDLSYRYLDPADVVLENADDDVAGFWISSVSGDTDEYGEKAYFTVSLRSKPVDNVTIGLTSSALDEGSVTPDNHTFTPSNWNASKEFTVTGQPDNISDGDQSYAVRLTGDNDTGDSGYLNLDPADVVAYNQDNESASIVLSPLTSSGSRVEVSESGTQANLLVRLSRPPSADVRIPVEFGGGPTDEARLWPDNLTFTPVNWNAWQTVVVEGENDNLSDGDQPFMVTVGAAVSEDTDFDSSASQKTFHLKNLDNDQAGFIVSKSTVEVSEGGTTDSFTVKLRSAPTDNVTISVTTSNEEGDASPRSLTFTTSDYNAPKPVNVSGNDDYIICLLYTSPSPRDRG